MEPIKLLHLLRHLSQQTACPQCKAAIWPEKIQIFSSTNTSAFLSMHCTECNHDLFAHAFLNIPSEELPSSLRYFEQEVSSEDLDAARAHLSSFNGDITDLFSS